MRDTENSLHPVVQWTMLNIGDATMVLQLHYVSSQEQLAAFLQGQGTASQFNAAISPNEALAMAEALHRHATAILAQKTPPQSGRH